MTVTLLRHVDDLGSDSGFSEAQVQDVGFGAALTRSWLRVAGPGPCFSLTRIFKSSKKIDDDLIFSFEF